jgi:hypothetical protein
MDSILTTCVLSFVIKWYKYLLLKEKHFLHVIPDICEGAHVQALTLPLWIHSWNQARYVDTRKQLSLRVYTFKKNCKNRQKSIWHEVVDENILEAF